jgi:photosystem II stability/assembly factor-like uncharacterized protein
MAVPGPSPTLVHVKLWNCALALAILASVVPAHAQWQIENSGTTADLRGIDNVGGGIAWASGSNGTVLRTEDAGYMWQPCAVPPGAEHLDFRGIQAFDANTAIVMSSGKGDLSRLYKTTDGCQTWKLVFTNPDKDGFWDALQFDEGKFGIVLGDPVHRHFAVFISLDQGEHWMRQTPRGLEADASKEGVFAASNSSLMAWTMLAHRKFVTGGAGGAFLFECDGELFSGGRPWKVTCYRNSPALPVGTDSSSAGAFSIEHEVENFVAVGGDYAKPDDSTGTAAYSKDGGEHWRPAQTPPHGFRSAVAYDAGLKTWITVGPNGTDISTDDGKNWRAVHPDPALHEAPDADRNWNALSLPFVVGPHGRIGRLDPEALKP